MIEGYEGGGVGVSGLIGGFVGTWVVFGEFQGVKRSMTNIYIYIYIYIINIKFCFE